MLKNYDDLSPVALDCLREIGNIGSSYAAGSLSSMLERPVLMRVPDVSVLEYEKVIDHMGGPEKIITGILVRLSGDISGMIMFLLEESFQDVVFSTLLKNSNKVNMMTLDETQFSVILEMGNIMSGSYINALTMLTNMNIERSVPSMTIDMLGAIMSVPITEFASVGDKVLFIDDGFIIDGVDIKSNIILIPEMASLTTLMRKLGVM